MRLINLAGLNTDIKIKIIYHFVYVFVNEAEAVLKKGCVSQT